MRLLQILPLAPLARVGEAFGMLFYAFGFERRRVCLLNLERCLPQLGESERAALARRHFRAVGRSLLERAILWWSPRERITGMVRVAGLEHLRALAGRPVIVLAPHFVSLDVGFARLACEMDLAGIYANQKSAVMNRQLYSGRVRFGRQRLFSRQQGVRLALAALKEGIPFYYLPDQDYGPRDAIFVPFFGVPAATITGLSRLARLARASVVPCVTRMLPGGEGYELRCYPAWENYPSDDLVADTRRMNAFVEERVREIPEQYFWTHKRFKTRPAGEARWY
ncbi:MAG: lipid A biosynthesis acyltransferase [Betaproteobacteria bacterium RIFCSPLOWO2_12_FULL_63_13]|nr:MAG: lipid A biosynthesis acyltransferase [Betaproteobacteria bacterium RIFCSPLOWO2_02_FULL_63_19]OGA44282.1 MAG: lipid A biosynthesis acyltransferase [Betaproteobacteria bacterium RIFCSPLOWO2_12_FULL_63_13]